jgi:cytochrome c peroxidase
MKISTSPNTKKMQGTPDMSLALLAIVLAYCIHQPAQAVIAEGSSMGLPSFCDENSLRAFPELPRSLKCSPAPEPYMIDERGVKVSIYPNIIKNKAAAVALGKMLFWDTQVGSDGIACASCHFQAGADNRIRNQINPGMRNATNELASDGKTPIANIFNFMATSPYFGSFPYISLPDPLLPAPVKGPNYTLKFDDFPLTQYKESDVQIAGQPLQSDRNAEIIYDTDDVISSQGVYPAKYTSLNAAGRKEICEKKFPMSGVGMPFFNVAGHTVRQVAPRNTPTVINAVYNFRNFWDGRANNVFNGLDPFGMRRFADPAKTPVSEIYVKNPDGTLGVKRVSIFNASLASQAVGPALSDIEMSCADKNFHELGKKMMALRPLGKQVVDLTDSVLGSYSAFPLNGTKATFTYKKMVQAAFNDAFWKVPDTTLVSVAGANYKLIENNFSLFWGLAIQAYEATLVSDDSRFDQAQEDPANVTTILTEQERRGFGLFMTKGKCLACHSGPEFTAASVNHVTNQYNIQDDGQYVERMVMGDGGIALYDAGFYNIGVRPTKEDIGVGATDPYGFPLSFARNAKKNANDPVDIFSDNLNITHATPDPLKIDSDLMDSQAGCVNWNSATTFSGYLCGNGPIASDERDAVDGSFKSPSLRNVELTGPYFHNGGQATLEQVIQFYNRGGDRKDHFQKKSGCENQHEPVLTTDEFGNQVVAADSETGLVDSTGSLPGSGHPSNVDPDIAGTRGPFETSCNELEQVGEIVEVSEPIDVLEPELPGELRPAREILIKEENAKSHQTLNLTNTDVDDLVAFLKTLTDERVRWEKAPFDHPSLILPNGHVGNEVAVKFNTTTNQALQESIVLPAVGSAGREVMEGMQALQPFEAGLQ